jgi:hypothetical protein
MKPVTNDKYDRQIRLWGADGQKRLATSHVVREIHGVAEMARTSILRLATSHVVREIYGIDSI